MRGYGREMDDAARVARLVVARLERIDELRRRVGRGDGAAPELLAELRALVPEAEAWATVEGDQRAHAAVTKLRREAEGMG